MAKWLLFFGLSAVAFVAWLKYEPKPIAVNTTFNTVKCANLENHHYQVSIDSDYDTVAVCTMPTIKSAFKTFSDKPVCRLHGGKLTCEECPLNSGKCTPITDWTIHMIKTKDDIVYGGQMTDAENKGLIAADEDVASTREPYESSIGIYVGKTPPQVKDISDSLFSSLENFTQDDLPMGLNLHQAPVCVLGKVLKNHCDFYFKANSSPDLYVTVSLYVSVANEKITDGRDMVRAYDFWKPYIQKSFAPANH